MNQIIIIGRLTKDVDLRTTQAGKSVASFTLAVNRGFGKDEADFISCVAWEKTAENMEKYTGKGSQVAVQGRIQTRNYDDKDGKKVYVTEVVAQQVQFLGSKQEQASPKPQRDSGIDELNVEDFQTMENDEILPF